MTRILLFYALSGFFSLGYQVAWFRIVTDWFGSTNFTFALVVVNFIGGLAVGALASRRATSFLVRRLNLGEGLKVYGLVELLVAASILLTFVAGLVPADLWGSFPYYERDGIWVHTWGYRIFQGLTAATCVFVPCFFMGVTFPLLCDRFCGHPRGARFPAALYAWNTLGACSGVLACQFLLLPRLGHGATLWLMAALNALLGGYFLSTRADFGLAGPSRAAAQRPQAPSRPSATPGALLVLVTLGGFLSGALEGDLFKRITFVVELNPGATMSLISFWAILAIFLASAAVHRFAWLRLSHIKIAFALAALYCLLDWPCVDAIRDFVESKVMPVPVEIERTLEGFRNLQFPSSLVQLLAFVGILTFPPYFLVSLLLPYACNQLQGERRHLGLAYGLNTLAFCVGLLGFVLIAPRVNLFYSLKLFTTIFGLSAAWLFVVREARPLVLWKPLGLLGALAAASLVVPADVDPSFFRKGTPPALHPIRAVKSNGANTTFVVDVMGSPTLFFGRLKMSATNLRARTYMRLMAHFPLLLNPRPEKALLICLGVGNTGSAIASHDTIRQIDVVELNEKIFETAPEFASIHRDFHLDPRVRFIHDDGRNFLNITDETYDLITSEPPPPLAAGVYRLYSREYYRKVREHLAPKGFMTQWLPLFLMTPEAVEAAVSTFVDVFPHAFLFTGFGTDFILAGSPSPIDLGSIEERFFESPSLMAELTHFNIQTPASLLARIVQGDAALRRRYGRAPLISDQHNDLEHLFLDPRARPIVARDPGDVLAQLKEEAPELHSQLEGILNHLGRLRYHVQGYPFETLATVDPETSPDVALAGVDWMELSRLYRENAAALRAGRRDRSMRVLERFLEISREQPEVLMTLAQLKMGRGEYDEAIALLRDLQALEPDDYLGHLSLGNAYRRAGRAEEALAQYRQASRLRPEFHRPFERMAWIHATHPDPKIRDAARATELAERAADIAGESDPSVRETLAAAYAASGQFERAAAVIQAAIDALPENRSQGARRLRRQLRTYRDGESLVDAGSY